MTKFLLSAFFAIVSVTAFAQQPSRFGNENEEKEQNERVSAPEEIPEEEDARYNSNQSNQRQSSSSARRGNSKLDRWRFGGNIGLGFANNYFYLNLAPRAYYLVKPNFALGAGFSWYYWSDNNDYPPGVIVKKNGSTYGPSLLSWYNPIGPLTLQAEYEPLNIEFAQSIDPNTGAVEYGREWVNALLLGGGIRQQSGRANFFILALYDVLYVTGRSFYPSPWVLRIGVGL
ncbi:MAG: hypothetical protein N4A46_14080 [Schleiferiaceae bacterium]|nr:hypothetical protein [Schleiferiaceae bacterium]